ncbi:PASTA domain-containing protein [Streptomyces sp. NPDC039016]|uniref:PASTA domain-containing protein n=1 Tax=Streptomyces sp. NPDC039016 TaxID=3154330 RepID=UPI0033D9959C
MNNTDIKNTAHIKPRTRIPRLRPPRGRLAPLTPFATAALTLAALAAAGPAHADGDTMPDVSGKGLVAAYQALKYDTAVRLKDGRGAGRHVLWPGSWKVCDQHPKAGTPFSHRPITLTVVKAHESCDAGR